VEGTCVSGCCQFGGQSGGGGGGNCPCSGDDAARSPAAKLGGVRPMEDIAPCSCDSDCDDDYCDPDTCTCDDDDVVVVDLSGAGFMLTSMEGGVKFDIHADGRRQQIAWTSTGWDGGFLVLDSDFTGRIDNGTKLFMELPAQPGASPKARPTGFSALATFDQPVNGGNGDGRIDARDAVYSKLRVWVDLNHNGVSDPGELFSLSQLGISSISLKYEKSRWTDVFGNRFGRKTGIVRNGPPQWIYTVHLNTAK
jgi:hypothetical protein